MIDWNSVPEDQRRVVLDILRNGPDCAKFLSRRIKKELGTTMHLMSQAERSGWIERLRGTFLFKPGFRRPKHMNHTYYQLTGDAKRELRRLARKGLI